MKVMVLIFALALALLAGNVAVAQSNADGLIKNGGFEEGTPGALPASCGIEKESGAAGTVVIDNTQSHSGKQSILINMTSDSGYLHPDLNVTLKPGSYILRAWAKMEPEQSFLMQIYDTRAWADKKPAVLQLEGKGILSKECRANNRDWSKFEVELNVTEEFPASIQIGLTKPGKLWLDDVEIVPSEKKTSAAAGTSQSNVVGIVKNGGFEEGVQGQLPVGCGIEKESGAAGTVAIDNSQSHSGKQSILVHMTSPAGYLHPSLNATLKPGCYIFRAWAKMDPEQSFLMQIYDTRAWAEKKPAALQLEGKGILSEECRASNREWNKFEVELNVTEEFPASIQIGLTKSGKLWLDDVEIVPSGKTPQEKPTAVSIKQSEQNLEIQNGKIALNITKGNPGVILSYRSEGRLCGAALLNAFQQGNAASVSSFKVVKDTPELAVAEVVYSFAGGLTVTVTYSVKNGFEYIEAESDFAQGKAAITATMKSEVLILPDFLADSMIFYPESAPAANMNIPADNHLLVNLFDNGNAMLTLLWDSPEMSITETKKGNLFDSAALSAGIKSKFWIGAVAAKGIWYKAAEKLNSGTFTALNWTPPFPAEWKLATFLDKGFHADTPTCESWFLIPKDNNGYIGNGVGFINLSAWQAWSSDLGGFAYPCYLQDNKVFAKYPMVQLNKKPVFNTAPSLIYSLNGTSKTPSDIIMPKNALHKLLPQALNNRLEAMNSPKNHYPATCGTTANVEKIFYRSESIKEKKHIQDAFVLMNLFVRCQFLQPGAGIVEIGHHIQGFQVIISRAFRSSYPGFGFSGHGFRHLTSHELQTLT